MAIDLEPGKAALGNARLVDVIIAEMDGGAIPFERFMELALYHPEHGYYRRPGRIGPQGDFLTSPVVHPIFGWSIAGWCHEVWRALGEPHDFEIVEPAAGDGTLAATILDWAGAREDGFAQAICYRAIEPHSPGADPRVTWGSAPGKPFAAGVVLSNEFFDALPVRLFEGSGRGSIEIYVTWDGKQFGQVGGPVSTIDDAPLAGRFEVNPRAYPTMRTMCTWVGRGAVLTFDYGYAQDELWAPWRKNGTLMAFYRHTAHEDLLAHVGEQDLTSHVNFSELVAAAEDEEMQTHGPVSQAAWLHALGSGKLVESARGDMAEYFLRRRAFERLTDPAGLGRIRVLAATRGLESVAGFDGDSQ